MTPTTPSTLVFAQTGDVGVKRAGAGKQYTVAAPGPGSRLGRFTLGRELGRGSHSRVYLALDTMLHRDVAVKVPAGTDDTASAAAIRREGRALARVRHDHVITLFDVVRAEGVDALVLELLTGPTLKVLVGQGRLAVDEVAALGLQLARGLCALHDAGVVHGDIKPSNLALTDGGLLKIFDLGVSRPSAGVWRSRAPAAGTPSYMPPERMRGDAGDVRSDIWSAGAVLFELATGRRAVDSLSSASRAALVRGGALPGVESLIRLLPQPLAPVVARAMDPLPRRRYQTAEQLDEALGQFARHRVSEPVRFRRLAGTASQAATTALVSFAV